jgi:hypothetical protein
MAKCSGNPARPAKSVTATDADKDAALSRDEWTSSFAKWFGAWDADQAGALDEPKLRAGLASVLPQPQSATRSEPERSGGGSPGGPGGFGGRGGGSGGSSWATPLVVMRGGRAEVLMNFPNRLVSYDPQSGSELWQRKGMGGTIYTSPAYGEGAIYTAGGGPGGGSGLAVKPGGDVLWKLDRVKSGTGARGGVWSSLLLADGKIYAPNQGGEVFVLRAAPKFELLATNPVGEPANASLAAADGAIYLRTDRALWCLAVREHGRKNRTAEPLARLGGLLVSG